MLMFYGDKFIIFGVVKVLIDLGGVSCRLGSLQFRIGRRYD